MNKLKKYLLILLSLSLVISLQAQEEDSSYKYWLTWGGMYDGENLSGNLGYSFSAGDNFYKVGYIAHGEFMRESPDFNSIDVSIGKRFQSEWWQAAIFAGPSYVFVNKSIGNGNREKHGTIGLQTDIQLLFRYADELGIGLGLWGNVNSEKSYAGFNIVLTLGNGK